MNFSQQIKKLRDSRGLTQEQMAKALGISRQAVSNWENDRNLPDIEMLISISTTFDISLDELILGERKMNNMTEKLIKDTNENHTARMNMITSLLGSVLLLIATALIVVRTILGDSVDKNGILHETFFLVPLAFAFFISSFTVFGINLARNVKNAANKPDEKTKSDIKINIASSAGMTLVFVGAFLAIVQANSGANTVPFAIACAAAGIVSIMISVVLKIKVKK